jgi:hypothetical protein
MKEGLNEVLSELGIDALRIRDTFKDLFDPDVGTVPIPFFGDILTAKVLTVGLNPSDGEIRGRHWPKPTNTPMLCKRLTQYFSNTQFRRHSWFDMWERALNEIGVSYVDGTAAHVDLCPWPTRPMSKLPPDRFVTLVTQSLPWFWRCVGLAVNLRLVLMAGAVNKKYYLNEFLAKEGTLGNTVLVGKVPRKGSAFVGHHQLRMAGKEFPVFFCSVSPSSRTSSRLLVRVRENRDCLIGYLT